MPSLGNTKINDAGLHRYLWKQRDNRDRVVVNIRDLHPWMGVGYHTLNTALARLKYDGRIRKVGYQARRTACIYEIIDPETWQAAESGPRTSERRMPAWG